MPGERFFRFHGQQHDHEEKEDNDRTCVDNDLQKGDEKCVKYVVERGRCEA